MPQMAPLWWEILFIMFIMSFMFIMIMMYFTDKKEFTNKNTNKNFTNQLIWTW
uniref:ATP synthase F0 subunit 8 n=2 Tax=Chinavia TaxID=1497371 RepID=A0A343YV99_9HEMI|nr:ATP synthase F0 subunit 8 [Chinavia impicticornis]AWN56182.1 ATP synthase F0 subunit 8 [Chinavia ubica]